MKKIVDGRIYPLLKEDEQKYTRRQDLPSVYQLNGALYVTRTKALLKENRMLGEYTIPYIMPQERSIDIDTQTDLRIAEYILQRDSQL
jgi:CMP-N-acetylneuraminic acid synthetase